MPISSKVLLSIDDDETISALIQNTLQITTGWTVITANSGQEGLCKAAAQPLDAILLDLEMPQLDGIETLYILRRNPVTLYIPVIFLTSSYQRIAPLAQTQLGFSGIIAKPFEPVMLANQIATILGWDEL